MKPFPSSSGVFAVGCLLAAGWLSAFEMPPPAQPLPEKIEFADGPFKPAFESFKQYKCPDWFRDAKLGIWAVWGPESVPEQGDWYARNMYIEGNGLYKYHLDHYGHPSTFGYKDLLPLWKAEQWNPDRLMELYKRAGAKYFCVIAQHHDNFDCWNSKYQRWNSVNIGPKRDIVAEWKQAATKQGLRFGVTEHLGASYNWYAVTKQADQQGAQAGVPYDGSDSRYADLYHAGNKNAKGWLDGVPETWKRKWFWRVRDLVDSYQPDLLYSDSGFPFDETGRQLVAHFYNENARWHGGKLEAVYNCKQDAHGMWVQDLERGVMGEIRAEPWQTDTCIGDWYYRRGIHYKSSTTVIQMLVDIVSKNGNLLLNIPPRPDGTLDPEAEKILTDLATWTEVNGEAIFGTRPWTVWGEGRQKVKSGGFNEGALRYTSRDLRFTTKGETLYAIALGWPDDGKLTVRSLAQPNDVTSVRLLGVDEDLKYTQSAEGLTLTLPARKPCEHAYALKISGKGLKAVAIPEVSAVIVPGPDGRVALRAMDAEIHGSTPQYESGGGKDNIGYWGDPKDFVSWNLKVDKPGNYEVEVAYSCATGSEGSQYVVAIGDAAVTGTSKATGSWATFSTEKLGEIAVEKPGALTLTVKPKTPPDWKVIGLKSLTLVPARSE